MVNHDYSFQLKELSVRVTKIENLIDKFTIRQPNSEKDWDNATLLREWKISKRTAANYRKQGLGSFKRGGRVYYTPEHRQQFLSICKSIK